MKRFIIYLILGSCIFFQPLGFMVLAQNQQNKEGSLSDLEQEDDLEEKNALLAFSMSLLVPGAGQIYVEENWWPGAIILTGLTLGIVGFIFIDQARQASLKPSSKTTGTENNMVTDARLELVTLVLQIGLPSLWIWNFADAFKRAEDCNKKVTGGIKR